jgi:two-component system CheB/CheR fusion protein
MTDATQEPAQEVPADHIDNVIPSRGYEMTPLVGLGGSAGAIPALQQFFESMPPDSGQAFVVVMHLAPEHESSLAELLQRCTAMPVIQLSGRTPRPWSFPAPTQTARSASSASRSAAA